MKRACHTLLRVDNAQNLSFDCAVEVKTEPQNH